MHQQFSIFGYLERWWNAVQLPLCISEFGTPETFDPATRHDDYNRFVKAGLDRHRVAQAHELRSALKQAAAAGIPIPYGGWYPGTGNIGWGLALTKERRSVDCDRAGLVDLARQPDGSLNRVLCTGLVKEVMSMRDIGAVATPAFVLDSVPVPAFERPLEVPTVAEASIPPLLLSPPRVGTD
jgi:hypothetical protein